ncbi:hypothetical protein [Saccharopolyspora gloriosae]|uniref:hypothetical protein n=1 Tax=Saccharopolyspora gloriosae TaxID=455344 RepID=UPI001FB6E20A|nr:hypothetical protein [Saccharopolyspora gloriosae]
MSKCERCRENEVHGGMTLCDPCLRKIGSAMQELERGGVDLHDPDPRINPTAPPLQPRGGCVLLAIALVAIPPGLVIGLIDVIA